MVQIRISTLECVSLYLLNNKIKAFTSLFIGVQSYHYDNKVIDMKTVTTSEFRKDLGSAYNAVQRNGRLVIQHRDRPDMILISQEHMDNEIDKAYKRGVSSPK